MFSSFKIGAFELAHGLIQAPLAGISTAPFRALFSHYTKPAYTVTEMISANSMLQHQTLNPRYLAHDKKEGPWCIQLSGQNPELLYEATQIATDYHPDLIDLNCGCPKPKIRAKGSGSALMDTPKKLEAIVTAMRKATHLPLTVKIRTAGKTEDKRYLEAARIIAGAGADAIIVHGRHYTEDYDIKSNYEQISRVVQSVHIPVIANGDVSDQNSLTRCLKASGAAGVMIARGSIGKPWLFQALLAQEVIQPSSHEVLDLFKTHINALAKLERSREVALLQARRLLKWYFPDLSSPALKNCYTLHSLEALYQTLSELL